MFLDLYEEVPLAALNYLTAECNYGGRVTDDKDRRTLTTAVRNIYCAGILQDGFFLNASGSYRVPIDELQSHEATVDYVRQWPLMPSPDVFGFNDNADITKDLKEVAQTLTTVLITQSAGGGGAGAKSFDEIMMEMSKDILAKLPPNFDMEVAMKRYPVRYDECKNTVICQELAKFNKLLDRVRGSLQTLQKAVKGLVVMDAALEGLSKNMLNNQTPLLWMKVSYPSLKPLSSYIAELLERLDFFQHWLDDGPPTVFQMPKFFFVQAFMTGVMQNFAKYATRSTHHRAHGEALPQRAPGFDGLWRAAAHSECEGGPRPDPRPGARQAPPAFRPRLEGRPRPTRSVSTRRRSTCT